MCTHVLGVIMLRSVRVCVCSYVCVNKRLNYMNIFVCLFDLSGVVSGERKGNGTDGTCFCFPPISGFLSKLFIRDTLGPFMTRISLVNPFLCNCVIESNVTVCVRMVYVRNTEAHSARALE